MNEHQQCQQLIQSLIANQENLYSQLQSLTQPEFNSTNTVVDFCAAKNQIFKQYIGLLELYALSRVRGEDMAKGIGLKIMQELVFRKSILMKLEPVEKKLQYQFDKLIKVVAPRAEVIVEEIGANDKSENIERNEYNKSEDKEESEENAEKEQEDEDMMIYRPRPNKMIQLRTVRASVNEVYVPPKISSALPKEEKQKLRQERQKEREKTHLIRKFQNEINEGDDAREFGVEDEISLKIKKKFEARTAVEEDNFIRFRETKKDRQILRTAKRRITQGDNIHKDLQEIKKFGKLFEESNLAPQKTKTIRK